MRCYAGRRTSLAGIRSFFDRWAAFPAAESGATQTFEVLLVVGVVLPPLFTAILLLQRMLKEYVEVSNILFTSPFF